VSISHGIEGTHTVASFKADKTPSILSFCSSSVVETELHFKEHEHGSQVLVTLHVDDVLQVTRVCVVPLYFFKVFIQDEFNPDLTDFAENSFCLSDLALLFKEFSKVIIARA
jgi:hypothetical protein